jgi:hypothetical protein
MRCREYRRADLHTSQIDDLQEHHLLKTKTPPPLAAVITQGITGWYRDPNYQIPLPTYNSIRPNVVLRKALNDQNAIGWGRNCMYSGHISKDFQTVHNIDRTWGSPDRNADAASPTRPPSSSRYSYSSTKSNVNGNFEMEHSTAANVPNTHSSTEHCYVPKLLDSTPTLKVYWHSTVPSSHDHSPLS